MSRFAMSDGMVVDTKNAVYSYDLRQTHNGNPDTRWRVVYRSRRGKWYLVHYSQWQGEDASAEYIDATEAARLILGDDGELPDYSEMTGLEEKLID